MVLLVFLLVLSVLTQVWALPSAVRRAVEAFPEVQPIAVTSVVGGVIAIACLQAAGVIGLRTLWLARAHRPDPYFYRWLWAIVALLAAFTALTVIAFIALSSMGYLTPGVMLGLIAAGLISLVAAAAIGLNVGTRR